jgi:hypothetical protein
MSAPDPQKLGEFEILEKLGHGGMGAVYKARQSSLGRLVALKVLPGNMANDDEFIVRFKAEARSAAALNHPGIVQVYAAGEDRGVHYFAMEYVDGESLQGRLERKGRIAPLEALAICTHVATALHHGWKRAQIIHRDIKPDNIFLSSEGEVKLGDLGLAKSLGTEGSHLTQTGTSMGTPYYISPEQAHGEKAVDFRSDIYSLGCTLFHLISGQTPYTATTPMAVMIKHITQPPPDIFATWPQCPSPLGPLLSRMLAKDPAQRHQSYEELIRDMMEVHEEIKHARPGQRSTRKVPATASLPPAPRPQTERNASPDAPKRRVPLVPLAALAGAAVLIISLGLWAPWKKAAIPAPQVTAPALIPAVAEVYAPGTPVLAGTDFVPIFNGRDLTGWDGDANHWWVSNGTIMGAATSSNPVKATTCLIWKGGPVDDFTLRLSFKITTGNSGVQYRSRMIDPAGRVLGGYQADLDADKPQANATLIDERGSRGTMAEIGEQAKWKGIGTKHHLAQMKERPTYRPADWNDLEITAQGDLLIHRLNGVIALEVTDEDPARQARSGLLGLQLRQGTDLASVQFREIHLKHEAVSDPGSSTPKLASPPTPPPRPPPTSVLTGRKIALFDGSDTTAWVRDDGKPFDWPIVNGALEVGSFSIATKDNYQDFRLHAEFWIPRYPANVTGQARGNSGVYLQRRYELQILDSSGPNPTATDCGAIYKQRAPDRNANTGPETWQSFDITFRAARFDAAQRKTANARITVIQNGTPIHNDVEIPAATGMGSPEGREPGPILLQSNVSKGVRFRNVWIVPQ